MVTKLGSYLSLSKATETIDRFNCTLCNGVLIDVKIIVVSLEHIRTYFLSLYSSLYLCTYSMEGHHSTLQLRLTLKNA